jgi:leader peptidase (prepilin peptidase)/N-methyltransferase
MDFIQNISLILQSSKVFCSIFFFFIGACLASFFNVVILRYPRMIDSHDANNVQEWLEQNHLAVPEQIKELQTEINLSFPSSHCFSCHTPLKWYHNIPVVSWLFLRGKCGFCKAPISWQYPLIELLGGLVFLASYLIFIPHGLATFALAAFFGMTCLLLAGTDMKSYLLPDELVYALMWVGLACNTIGINLMPITLSESIYGLLTGFISLWVIRAVFTFIKKQEAMGAGDLKLLAALGVYIGVKGVLITLFYSSVVGLAGFVLIKLLLSIFGKKTAQAVKESKDDESSDKSHPIPFGPALIIGAIIYLLSGDIFIQMITNA